jgi:1,4-alpha-glucan branching enzyme
VRKIGHEQKKIISLITPAEYLRRHPTNQIASPGASSWGEEGYWRVWLNESNEWIYPHLQVAQERMTDLARQFPAATGLTARALRQAARELLLAQASDWPFILRAKTSPEYARRRVKDHLLRFIALHEQLTLTRVDEAWLSEIESRDNLFPDVNWNYWK